MNFTPLRTGDPVTNRNLDQISTAVGALAGAITALPNWLPLIPANGWQVYDKTVFTAPAYYQDSTSRIWLRGLIKSGSTGTAMFSAVLPKPRFTLLLVCTTNTGVGEVRIGPDGNIKLQTGGTGYVSLDSLGYVI